MIAQVVNSLECGGLEKMVIHLSVQLRAMGQEVVIICLRRDGELAAEARRKGLTVICCNHDREGFSPALISRLFKLLKQHGVRLVHAHNPGPLVYGAMAGKANRSSVIYTRHGRSERPAPFWIWGMVDHAVGVSSDALAVMLASNRGLGKEKSSVIVNAVDESEFASVEGDSQALRSSIGLPPSALVIGMVGRLVVEKDYPTLLEAFARLVRPSEDGQAPVREDVRLVIVGDGPLRNDLEQLTQKLRISSKVHFLGFREDVSRLVALMDIFALSSIREGIPLTLLEAMAARKPVVVTAVGGMPEVVVDDKTGLLVPPEAPDEMARCLKRLLQDRRLRMEMGAAGQQRLEKEFGLKKMVQAYASLYNEVSSSGAPVVSESKSHA